MTPLLFMLVAAAAPAAATTSLELVDVARLDPRFVLDIRYATPDNFTGRQLYPVARCLLRREVAEKVVAAQSWLDRHGGGYVLMLKDCYRPESVQRRMWQVVQGTPMQAYVADPDGKTGSVHNYGAAVDLTLSKDGREVDMGTPYDHLGVLAEPRHEERFLAEGKLRAEQVAARRALREAMVKGGGFRPLAREWWHFDALQGAELRRRYPKLDVPIETAAP